MKTNPKTSSNEEIIEQNDNQQVMIISSGAQSAASAQDSHNSKNGTRVHKSAFSKVEPSHNTLTPNSANNAQNKPSPNSNISPKNPGLPSNASTQISLLGKRPPSELLEKKAPAFEKKIFFSSLGQTSHADLIKGQQSLFAQHQNVSGSGAKSTFVGSLQNSDKKLPLPESDTLSEMPSKRPLIRTNAVQRPVCQIIQSLNKTQP